MPRRSVSAACLLAAVCGCAGVRALGPEADINVSPALRTVRDLSPSLFITGTCAVISSLA